MTIIFLALAKVAMFFLLLAYVPRKYVDWFALKHPFWADVMCTMVVPIPLLIFGGVTAAATAIYFGLCMAIAVRLYRAHRQRPLTERVFVRFWKRADGTATDLRETSPGMALAIWWVKLLPVWITGSIVIGAVLNAVH